MSNTTFVLTDSHGVTQSSCNLHVDDGFLVVNVASPEFQKAFQDILQKLAIKECINLQEIEHKYLEIQTWQIPDGSISGSMENTSRTWKPSKSNVVIQTIEI